MCAFLRLLLFDFVTKDLVDVFCYWGTYYANRNHLTYRHDSSFTERMPKKDMTEVSRKFCFDEIQEQKSNEGLTKEIANVWHEGIIALMV